MCGRRNQITVETFVLCARRSNIVSRCLEVDQQLIYAMIPFVKCVNDGWESIQIPNGDIQIYWRQTEKEHVP